MRTTETSTNFEHTPFMSINDLTSQLNGPRATSRRQVIKRLGIGAAGIAGLKFLAAAARAQEASAMTNEGINVAVLEFALNLEYLEAEYYTYATTGQGIEQLGVPIFGEGRPGPTLVKPNPQVPFADPDVRQFAREIAGDERTHVRFIRETLQALGATPPAKPTIDLNHSWDVLAQAAGIAQSFDPFANDINFLLGAFVFEDVGVTAYRGAAPLLTNGAVLSGAAGLLGTEAYHAGNIRTVLYLQHNQEIIEDTRKISNLRDALDLDGDDDQPIVLNGMANIVPTDQQGLVFARTRRQVLNIVYFAPGAETGGFFPHGINP